ncbi:MAG: hypothetical protein IJV15_00405 [Lachnospiraceae bacterium]|nr:hypothetical protein [Lachnospiraceae bacterium]
MVKVKNIIIWTMIVALVLLSGCGKQNYPDLPDNAIAFRMSSFEDKEHDDELMETIEYNGRIYAWYGGPNSKFKQTDIDKCIGYIIQDENVCSVPDIDNKDWKVYTLACDKDNNFLMDYIDDGVDLMPPPKTFYRAIDTKEKDIEIPEYIDNRGYDYWK